MALNGPLMKFIDSKRTDLPFELSASDGNYISRCLLRLKGLTFAFVLTFAFALAFVFPFFDLQSLIVSSEN